MNVKTFIINFFKSEVNFLQLLFFLFSLSNDIDSFVVQYIIENLAYVAEDYEKEMEIATQYPDRIKKTVTLQPASSENLPYK